MGVSDLIAFGEKCTAPGGCDLDSYPDRRRTPEIAAEVGATFRQIDYWARIGLVVPSGGSAAGSGSRRGWSDDDVALLRLVVRLRNAGLELTAVESVLDAVTDEGLDPDRTVVAIGPDGVLKVHTLP